MRSILYAAGVAAGIAAAGSGIPTAQATVITSQLNCPVIGHTVCTSTTASYGTLTFADDATDSNKVDISISLIAGLTIQQLTLNYDETKFNNLTPFTATIGGNSVSVENNENAVILNGSGNFGGFVLGIPVNGTLTGFGNSFTIVLAATGFDLNAIDFANQFNQGLDAAVHLQNCGPNSGTCQPLEVGSNSLAVGEKPGTTGVPEPATLGLLGAGLLGIRLLRRRRRT
jgi:hypothetical protein